VVSGKVSEVGYIITCPSKGSDIWLTPWAGIVLSIAIYNPTRQFVTQSRQPMHIISFFKKKRGDSLRTISRKTRGERRFCDHITIRYLTLRGAVALVSARVSDGVVAGIQQMIVRGTADDCSRSGGCCSRHCTSTSGRNCRLPWTC
jgi:hypothetical protein